MADFEVVPLIVVEQAAAVDLHCAVEFGCGAEVYYDVDAPVAELDEEKVVVLDAVGVGEHSVGLGGLEFEADEVLGRVDWAVLSVVVAEAVRFEAYCYWV